MRRRRRRDNLFADPCSTVSVCENYFSSYSFSFALFLFSSFFFLLRFDNPLDSVIVVATQIRSREKTSNGEFQFDVRVSFRGFDLRSIEERKDYISTKDFSSQWKSWLSLASEIMIFEIWRSYNINNLKLRDIYSSNMISSVQFIFQLSIYFLRMLRYAILYTYRKDISTKDFSSQWKSLVWLLRARFLKFGVFII